MNEKVLYIQAKHVLQTNLYRIIPLKTNQFHTQMSLIIFHVFLLIRSNIRNSTVCSHNYIALELRFSGHHPVNLFPVFSVKYFHSQPQYQVSFCRLQQALRRAKTLTDNIIISTYTTIGNHLIIPAKSSLVEPITTNTNHHNIFTLIILSFEILNQ